MKVKALLAVLVMAAVVVSTFGIVTAGSGGGGDLISQYEPDKEFEKSEFGNTTIYWHQRQIGDAAVEGDYINYQFNTTTGELISKTERWREGLPTELPQNLITEDEALETAGGGEYAKLYYLSLDSTIYRPAPETPVWVVWHDHEPDRWGNVTVIDAITGEFIASGIPPILSNEILPSRPDSTVVLDNGVEATFLGMTSDGNYEWQATIGAPKYLDDLVTPIEARWNYDANKAEWTACDNLFTATVKGSKVTVWYNNTKLSWQPDVFIGTNKLKAGTEQLLINDPINENYYNNTLNWDFGDGITRSVRIIEGMLQEYYTIDNLPTDDVMIISHSEKDAGFVWTRPAVARDNETRPVNLTIDGDDLTLTLETMQNSSFPITIDPVFTTSSRDGCLEFYPAVSYRVAREAATASKTPCDFGYYFVIGQYYDDNDRFYIGRSFVYFNTASLPENINITSATLRLRGGFDHSDQDFYIQIQSGMPDHPCDPMTKADYDKAHYSGNGGQLVTTDFVAGSYNEILLTSEGRSWINTAGWTKLCLRSSRDINPFSEPGGREAVSAWAYEMGEGYWPELVVTYETNGDMIEAFIFTGPIYADPCYDGWYIFVDNVESFLGEMGYEIFRPADYPNASVLEQYIGNNEIAVLYEHCHGGVNYFWSSCDNMTYTEEVEAWLANYPKIPFVFLANCNGLCETGPGTLVGAFSKGSLHCGVIVGYCGMSYERCRDCATYRYFWEEMFFSALAGGDTVEEAYNLCTREYKFCEDCILYYGDGDMQLKEKIERGLCSCSVVGEVRDVNTNLLSGVEVALYEHGGGFYDSDVASSDYSIEVDQLGEYWLRASASGNFTLDTNKMPLPRNPYYPDYIGLTTPELLTTGYNLDFEGDYGLVPRACNMSYAMTSVNHWIYTPIDEDKNPHPEWQLSSWKAMEPVHSWQFPA